MRFAEPDIYLTGTLVNGLPTCSFAPKTYNRKITVIVVTNSVPSTVSVYRGQLRGVPVAQSQLGNSNTLRGSINIPSGQPFFVQWSALGTSVTDATARVSIERDDNPLEGSGSGHEWDNQLIDSITIPNTAGPNDSAIVIGQAIPAELSAAVSSVFGFGATAQAIAAIIYRYSAVLYQFDVLVRDTTNQLLMLVRGSRDSGSGITFQNYVVSDQIAATATLYLGTQANATHIGDDAGAGLHVTGDPIDEVRIKILNATIILFESGQITVRAPATWDLAAHGTMITGFKSGDAADSFILTTDGIASWGDGTASPDVSMSRAAAGKLGTDGDFLVTTAGRGYRVKEGANAKMGTAVLVAGTVTVNNTSVTANSRIILTPQNNSGTPGAVSISARVAGTSFTIKSTNAADTSTVAWIIFEPA